MKTIQTELAPLPTGHYSQAIVHGGLVYVSGQLPISPGSFERRPASIEDEAIKVLSNLEAILRSAGSDRSRVLRITVYIADMGLWDRFNTVYAAFFQDHRPARSVVPTGKLHFGFSLEIDAVAAVSESE